MNTIICSDDHLCRCPRCRAGEPPVFKCTVCNTEFEGNSMDDCPLCAIEKEIKASERKIAYWEKRQEDEPSEAWEYNEAISNERQYLSGLYWGYNRRVGG